MHRLMQSRVAIVVSILFILAVVAIAPWMGGLLVGLLWILPIALAIAWAVGVWRLLEQILQEQTAIRHRLETLEARDETPNRTT
jgi:predicted RND superfamily exporter protein